MKKPASRPRARRARLVIRNARGLHARPAAMIVQCLQPFSADIQIAYGGQTVSARSILGLMMLAAPVGAALDVIARGADAKAALATLAALVESGFSDPD